MKKLIDHLLVTKATGDDNGMFDSSITPSSNISLTIKIAPFLLSGKMVVGILALNYQPLIFFN